MPPDRLMGSLGASSVNWRPPGWMCPKPPSLRRSPLPGVVLVMTERLAPNSLLSQLDCSRVSEPPRPRARAGPYEPCVPVPWRPGLGEARSRLGAFYIIDRAEQLRANTANALLKTLEEPPRA